MLYVIYINDLKIILGEAHQYLTEICDKVVYDVTFVFSSLFFLFTEILFDDFETKIKNIASKY